MSSPIEKSMEAEDAIIQQCARIWGPNQAVERADRLMVRAGMRARQDREIVALMQPESDRIKKLEK